MSKTLDAIRKKYPAYASVPTSKLAVAVADKYPVYLDNDPDLAKQVRISKERDALPSKATTLSQLPEFVWGENPAQEIARGAERGLLALGEMGYRGVQVAGAAGTMLPGRAGETAGKLKRFGGESATNARVLRQEVPGDTTLGRLVETGVQTLGPLAAGPAGLPAIAAAAGFQSGAMKYGEDEAGGNPSIRRAIRSGLITGLATYLGGATGVESVLKAGKPGLRNLFKRMSREGFKEIPEEVGDDLANELWDRLEEGRDLNLKQLAVQEAEVAGMSFAMGAGFSAMPHREPQRMPAPMPAPTPQLAELAVAPDADLTTLQPTGGAVTPVDRAIYGTDRGPVFQIDPESGLREAQAPEGATPVDRVKLQIGSFNQLLDNIQASTSIDALSAVVNTAWAQEVASGLDGGQLRELSLVLAAKKLELETPAPPEPAVAPPEPTVAPPEPTVAPPEPTVGADLTLWARGKLESGEPITWQSMVSAADTAFGGTMGSGAYSIKDAYDAVEAAVNGYVMEAYRDRVNPETAAGAVLLIDDLTALLENLPTQSKRTEEQDEFQQFSTPPPFAFAINWLSNVRPTDTVLEPSGGVGGIAAFAKASGATVVVNELSKRRRKLLERLGFDRVFGENAEHLNAILPKDVRPTVVEMNPPFSATAGRIKGKRTTQIGAKHIEQALERLVPGGRLVAIAGEGMAMDRPAFRQWWKQIQRKYNVRAVVKVSGEGYRKYGTTFDNVVMVIDKTGGNLGTMAKPLVAEVSGPAELVQLLEGIRNDRPQAETVSAGATVEPATGQPARGESGESGGGEPVQRQSGGVRPDAVGPGGSGGGQAPATGVATTGGERNERAGRPAGGPGLPPAQRGPGRAPEQPGPASPPQGGIPGPAPSSGGGAVAPESPGRQSGPGDSELQVGVAESPPDVGEEQDAAGYEAYRPRVSVAGSKAHPTELAESAAMASVNPPTTTYAPNLPKKAVDSGALSDAQLEAVTMAGAAHAEFNANGTRKGFFIGDGTGVGKGREIAAILWDNHRSGRQQHVWVSQKRSLVKDALRDLQGVGWKDVNLIDLSKVKASARLKKQPGVLFLTYDTLKGASKAKTGEKGQSRLEQVKEWLGSDFDGVIAFDESHEMGNALEIKGNRGTTKPSQKALAGLDLQREVPKARVVYVSATGATEPSNLTYAERLGLWGDGTAFASVKDFVSSMVSGGIAAMEVVARDLKALGKYLARNLSFRGVTYDRLEQTLTPVQEEIYDELAGAWQMVLRDFEAGLQLTGGDKDFRAKAQAKSVFWSAHQRFFNQVLTSMQMPAVTQRIREEMQAGNAVVLQLVNTNEAEQERQLAKRSLEDDEENDSEIDLTPKEGLMQLIQNNFPTQKYEEYQDEDGNIRSRVVKDSQGHPVEDPEAVALRDALLDRLASIRVPDGPLESLYREFGTDQVAEVTGRRRRVVPVVQKDGSTKWEAVRWGRSHADADANAFMDDRKPILVFSMAGGTGRGYHADRNAKNQRKRIHILLQPGWRADAAVQGFGRTHRSNQVAPPHYLLATTNLPGQKRFISSIARRLDQLGALTKGERKTGSQGIFKQQDNLESQQAKDALQTFFFGLLKGDLGISLNEFQQQTGLEIVTENGQMKKDMPPITQFLNRMLSLKTDLQRQVFAAFERIHQETIAAAEAAGTLDSGVEDVSALSAKVVQEVEVYTHPDTGAKTRYVELELEQPAKLVSWEVISRVTESYGFIRNKRSGKLWGVTGQHNKTLSDGRVEKTYSLRSPTAMQGVPAEHMTGDRWEKIPREAAEPEWRTEVQNAPKTTKHRMHMIEGILLPIWNRLPNQTPQVKRAKIDDGRRVLGRVIPEGSLGPTLEKLGAEANAPDFSPDEVLAKILEDGFQFNLANGWKLVRRRVSGEPRIEIEFGGAPVSTSTYEGLKRMGAFTERINFNLRAFVPTGDATVLSAILQNFPLTSMVNATRGGTSAYGMPAGASGARMPMSMAAGGGREVSIPDVMRAADGVIAAAGGHTPIRKGRFFAKARGIYKPEPMVIRLRSEDNIPTMTHELGHALQHLLWGEPTSSVIRRALPPGVSAELVNLGKALYGNTKPAAGYTGEGFAEFLRYYLTRDDAAKVAPAMVRHWEGVVMPANPEVNAAMLALRQQVDGWRMQGPVKRARASMVKKPGRMAKMRQALADFVGYQGQVDEFEPLLRLSQQVEATQGHALAPSEDPFLLASWKRGTAGPVVEEMATRGMVDIWGNPTGVASLEEALAPVKRRREDFTMFVWAKRSLERWGQGKNPGMTQEDALWWYQQFKYDADFQLASDKLQAWWDGVLDYLVEGNPALGEMVAAIRNKSQFYVPLAREIPPKLAKRRELIANSNPMFRMHGSGLRVYDLWEQSLENASRLVSMAHRQLVLQSIVKLAELPGMGYLVERVPRSVVKQQVTLDRIADQLREMGVDLSGTEIDAELSWWVPALQPKGTDPIVAVNVGGTTQWFQVSPEVYEMVNGLDVFRMHPVADLFLGAPARLFRMGTTGLRPGFSLVTNPLRDVQALIMQTQSHANPALLAGRWVASMADQLKATTLGKPGPYSELFRRLGLQIGQPLGIDIGYTKRAANRLWHGKLMKVVGDPLDMVREWLSFPEAASRVAEIKSVAKELGWQPGRPLSPDQAVRLAIAGKRATVDFSAAGRFSKAMNQAIPFYNATIQGARTFARTVREHPARATLMGLSMLTMPALLLWWRYKDEDWYRELPWRDRWFYTHIKQDDGIVWKIPRAFEWSLLFQVMPEAIFDSWYRQDPEAVQDALGYAFDSVNPVDWPVLAKLAKEQWQNRIDFFDRPIVPAGESYLLPGEQRGPYTSRLSEWLGDLAPKHISPRRVDAAVRALFGGAAIDLMDAIGLGRTFGKKEFEAADIPVVGRLWRRGGVTPSDARSVSDLYDAVGMLEMRGRSKASRKLTMREEVWLKRARATLDEFKVLREAATATPDNAKRRAAYQTMATVARGLLEARPEE